MEYVGDRDTKHRDLGTVSKNLENKQGKLIRKRNKTILKSAHS